MLVNLETILSYVETIASTNSDLVNHIKVVRPKEPTPNFKDYGLRVYFGDTNWLENTREKIGPILTQRYRVNVDLVFNKQLTSRNVFSAAKGISYWESVVTFLYANRNGFGLFRDSYWTPVGSMEQNDESIIIKGILHVTVDTKYDPSRFDLVIEGEMVSLVPLPQPLSTTSSPSFSDVLISGESILLRQRDFIGNGVPNSGATYLPDNNSFNDSIGNDGDTFLDEDTKDLYVKESGSWT